jgi:hypothetical protein
MSEASSITHSIASTTIADHGHHRKAKGELVILDVCYQEVIGAVENIAEGVSQKAQ